MDCDTRCWKWYEGCFGATYCTEKLIDCLSRCNRYKESRSGG